MKNILNKKGISSIDKYQKKCLETAIYPNQGNNIIYTLFGLGSEAGECQGIIKKAVRDYDGNLTKKLRDKMIKELGDCFWYLTMTCWELKILPSEVLKINIDKLDNRKNRGVIGGSGDNR